MRLLILTQKIDINDPVLGFFHNWVIKLSKKYEKVSVICLQKGEYDLPENTKVYSLGKESGRSKIKYIKNFLNLILGLHKDYDAVFVHMNQEYVLLGGFFWKLLGKKVYMWRNHHSGSILTDISSLFCNKIFCTSKYSYTAKYKKTQLMPVGVDADKFKIDTNISRQKNSILFLGRIAPAKNVHTFIESLELLNKKGINFTANIYGDALPQDSDYYEGLVESVKIFGFEDRVKFHKGIPNYKTPAVYNAHEIFVNLSSNGMYDKTIFEAMVCGCLTLASNRNLEGNIDGRCIIEEVDRESIYQKIQTVINLGDLEKEKMVVENLKFAESHSLSVLVNSLVEATI